MTKIIGISGSLRKKSYNTALLHAAIELLPPGMSLEIANIHEVPLYNGDIEDQGFPKAVTILREQIRAADGILIATPEYNYSMSGVIKNVIDWLSRPASDPVLTGKPLALIGASQGMMGSARAQYHLRQTVVYLDLPVLNRPELFVAFAQNKFDEDLKLTDTPTREILGQLLESFQRWIQRLQ